MARWRLMNPHYLNTVDNQWEHKETDRNTGRTLRKVYEVPRYFDPADPGDCNYPGECIVCHEGKGQRQDHIFRGPPTPEMEPLDDEAKAISEAESPKWVHPIETLPGQLYSEARLAEFQKQLADLIQGKQANPAPAVPASAVDPEAFAKMQEQLQALMESNAALQAQLAERSDRRI